MMETFNYQRKKSLARRNLISPIEQDKKTFPLSLPVFSGDGVGNKQHNTYHTNSHSLCGGFQLPTHCPPFYFPNDKVFAPEFRGFGFPIQYPLELDVDFSGTVNLDEVPMEIVTSDEDEGDGVHDNYRDETNNEQSNLDHFDGESSKEEKVDLGDNDVSIDLDDVTLLSSPSCLSQKRNNYSTELDEIELRSRALRSLLLLKRTRAIESIQNRVSLLPTDISTANPLLEKVPLNSAFEQPKVIPIAEKSYTTKLLAIGSGKLRTNGQNATLPSERFVIHLSDSSCSSDECELSEMPVNSVHDSQLVSSGASCTASSRLSMVTSASDSLKSPVVSISTSCKQRVTEKTHSCVANGSKVFIAKKPSHFLPSVSNQKYVKRPSRVFRKISPLRSCHQNTKRLPKLQNQSLTSASPNHNPDSLLVTRNQIASIQATKTSVTAAFSVDGKLPDRTQSPSTFSSISSIYLRIQKRLMQLSLDILQRTRSTSVFSHTFSFDPHSTTKYTESTGLSCSPEVSIHTENAKPIVDRQPRGSCIDCTHKVNPSVPLCPFLLDGECKDTSCIYQHPAALRHNKNFRFHEQTKTSNLRNVSISVCSSSSSAFAAISPVPVHLKGENCPVCHENLDTVISPDALTAMQKWHILYRVHRRNLKRDIIFSQFREQSLEILQSAPTCSQLVSHHISALCLFSNSSQLAADILTTLKLTAFSVSACRMVLRHPSVSPFIRISLGQLVIECLLSRLLSTEENLCNSIDLAFIHSVYHVCQLKLELGSNTDSVLVVLDEMRRKLPDDHFLHWALWWFKLHLSITRHLPSEESLSFTTPSYQLLPKVSVKNCRTLIEEAARNLSLIAVASCDSLTNLSSLPRNALSFCCLSVISIYIQLLKLLEQYAEASELCLHFYNISPLWVSDDDLLFTTAMHSMFITHSTSLEWHTVVAKARWLSHVVSSSSDYLSFRIEFHFFLALSTWRKKMQKTAKTVLLELLGSLTMLSSEDDADVLCGFRNLLGVSNDGEENCNLVTVFFESMNTRGRIYMWLSYCLYGLLCNSTVNALKSILSQLIGYYRKLPEDHNFAFTKLLLRMIITLANRVYLSESDAYAMTIRAVFLDTPLSFRTVGLPAWFLEVIQGIYLGNLQSPGVRHDICVQLVETYGASLVFTLCRSLFALNDRFLAGALCSIAKLDRPDRVDFWLLSAALLVSDQMPEGETASEHRISTMSRLAELLDEAISLIPSSTTLWQLYTDTAIALNTPTDPLLKRAISVGMNKVVLTEIEAMKESKTSTAARKPNLNTSRRGPLQSSNRWNKLITSKYIFKPWANRNTPSTPSSYYQRLRLHRKPAKS